VPRTTQHPKEASFNMRIDPKLKEAFTKAAEAEDKPAAQVVRTFMRAYVRQRERRAFEAQARRDSLLIAERARDPNSDEAQVMREIEADLADESFWAD
jgi:antitoxin component of RelBE/YafQ-DinJ toxin-antitoxin module